MSFAGRFYTNSITVFIKGIITQQIMYHHENRTERTELDWLSNPSAPLTEEALERFTQEATRILTERLNQLDEAARSITP